MDIKKKINSKELIEAAIRLEQQSVNLYKNIAGIVNDSALKSVFKLLATEEENHVDTFNRMAGRITYELGQEHNPEHIPALVEHFTQKILSPDTLKEKIRVLNDLDSIFKFAISIELDHITYYTEIKDYMNEEDKGLIQELIAEERKHFHKLMQYKKSAFE